MKYLLLDEKNIIIHVSETLEYQENGNPLVDNGTLAFAKYLVANIAEIDETVIDIPEDYVPYKYMYLSDTIIVNPTYVEPVPPMDVEKEVNDLKASTESLEIQMTDAQLALVETYESSENQITDLQVAITELYELVLGLGL